MAIPAALVRATAQLVLERRTLFYYDSGGEQPAILLIHGLGDEADTWRHMIAPLAARYRVIAPDLPGFGRSAAPHGGLSSAFFARTLLALLAALDIPQATVVGSSMGATIALRLALAQPAAVSRLVLLDGAPPVGGSAALSSRTLQLLLPGLGEAVYTRLRQDPAAAYATLRPYYADLDALPAADRAFLFERVQARVWSVSQRRAFFSALRWLALDGALRADQIRRQVTALRTPTALVWGAADRIAPAAAGYALAALMPSATITTIPECGHLPQQEQPAALLALIG